MENIRIRFVALGFMDTVLVAVIAMGTGCLGVSPGSDVQAPQTRDYVGGHTNEMLLKATVEADDGPQVRPTPDVGGGDARDCADCHADETYLKAMARSEEAPPTDTDDG